MRFLGGKHAEPGTDSVALSGLGLSPFMFGFGVLSAWAGGRALAYRTGAQRRHGFLNPGVISRVARSCQGVVRAPDDTR